MQALFLWEREKRSADHLINGRLNGLPFFRCGIRLRLRAARCHVEIVLLAFDHGRHGAEGFKILFTY